MSFLFLASVLLVGLGWSILNLKIIKKTSQVSAAISSQERCGAFFLSLKKQNPQGNLADWRFDPLEESCYMRYQLEQFWKGQDCASFAPGEVVKSVKVRRAMELTVNLCEHKQIEEKIEL